MGTIEERMERYVEKCRQAGLKATHQRTEILRQLATTKGHPDVETIFMRVRKSIPTISLDTVYRTLRTMEENGVIARIGPLGERSRFDANTVAHFHFICLECDQIEDFDSNSLSSIPPPPEATQLGHVDQLYIEARGLCRKCRSEKSK